MECLQNALIFSAMDFHICHTFQASFVVIQRTFFHSLYCCPLWFYLTYCPFPALCLLQPVIDGYRNKSTFSVNRGPDGNPKTVGYYLGTWRGQLKAVTSRNNKPKTERKGEAVENSVIGRGKALKEKVELEVFDAQHDHEVNLGYFWWVLIVI